VPSQILVKGALMQTKKKIVAIGGGELKDLETLEIDKEIIRLTSKQHPRALFLPTANDDADWYCQIFQDVYGDKLGCAVDFLYLRKEKLTKEQIEEKMFSADLIYVGGGSTLKMMKLWRRLRVDDLLLKAYNQGIVLSGLSAGAICWFKYGHSDSFKMVDPSKNFIRVKGLGWINATHCPHFHAEKREKDFEKMISLYGGIGIALDNNTALELIDDQYMILTSKKEGYAYKLYKKNGRVVTEPIEQKKDFAPILPLLGTLHAKP
jgi:dipeptidase E